MVTLDDVFRQMSWLNQRTTDQLLDVRIPLMPGREVLIATPDYHRREVALRLKSGQSVGDAWVLECMQPLARQLQLSRTAERWARSVWCHEQAALAMTLHVAAHLTCQLVRHLSVHGSELTAPEEPREAYPWKSS